jgi:predicted ATPase
VLHERRKAIHERTAQAMETLYRATLDEHYSELAHHYSRSGNAEKAVEYLHLAGQQAVQRSAHAEAISHLTTALELLSTLPDTPARTQHELMLQVALGLSLMATKGPAAPEVETAYVRARTLCQQVGETPQLFPVLRGLCTFYLNRGELHTAHELGEQLLRLAQRVQDSALLLEAHHWLGETLFYLGEFAAAQEHLEQSLALYDPQQHRSLALIDPRVFCLGRVAQSLWLFGYPDQALQRSQEALTWAQELSHPSSLRIALGLAAFLHQVRREVQAAQERAEAAIRLATEQGFMLNLAVGTFLRGWALAEQGQGEEGIAQMRQGLTAVRATGQKVARPRLLATLAEAYGKVGQAEEGLTLLAEALALVNKTGERWWEAELCRLKGELTLVQSNIQSLGSSVQKEAEEY